MGLKLNRKAKAGIAIGLSALVLFTTAIFKNIDKQTNNLTPSTSTSTEATITNDYIDTLKSNEFKVYDENLNTTYTTLTEYDYINFLNTLNSHNYNFQYAPYYGLDESIKMYNETIVKKSSNPTLLDTSGKLDPNKLVQQIKINNEEYMAQGKNAINTFYTDISAADMNMICNIIAEVVNSKFNTIEIAKVANTLMEMTMFERKGSASNAYITNNITFIYNPTMSGLYADMQEIQGTSESKEETLKQVITHEVMHLLQYAASDSADENGLEAGMLRMYNIPNKEKKVPVDSLWASWLLEAAAELKMAEYLNIEPGTYAKKISYARSYNLSRFNDLDLGKQKIEDIVFNHTLEEGYKDLELKTPEEQLEFLKYLYSIEITQTDPEEFWEQYTAKTGLTPTDAEKTAIRMDIRTDAVKYLTKSFYENLADSIKEQKINDLDTIFYLMRTWELDVYGHLEYTKTNSLGHAKDFIIWHEEIQTALFNALAESNNLTGEQIKKEYEEYNLQVNIEEVIYENCNLNNYNIQTSSYIKDAKNNYTTRNFSRNNVVYDYIRSNEKTEIQPHNTK